jgi:hypothetical protein
MTTVQLLHRIARHARSANGSPGGDFTTFSLTEQTDLLEAANSALQTVYGALPTVYKELTQSFLLAAPAAVTTTVTQYSTDVGSDTFTGDQIGCSVVLDGDPSWNLIVSTDELLNPYLGPTGTTSGTVYGDGVYSTRYPFDRIIGNPRYPNRGSATMFNPNLIRVNGVDGPGSGWFYQMTVGWPQFWWTQMWGNSQGNEPLMVLRVSPAPSAVTVIDVRMAYWPKRLTLTDYDNATAITVPDQFIEKSLIPLALRALMSTPIWRSNGDEDRIEARAIEGEVFLRMQPGQIAAPNNRIYTPVGF